MNAVPLYEMFPFLKGQARLAIDYNELQVISATVNNTRTELELTLSTPESIPPTEIASIENLIAEDYGMNTVNIHVTRTTASALAPNAATTGHPQQNDKKAVSAKLATLKITTSTGAIMGRVTKTAPKQIIDVTIDDGKATVRGYVCDVRSKYNEKNNAWWLDFDITDYTSTINVRKFMLNDKQQEGKAEKVVNSVKKGMYLTVSGILVINNYDGELTLNPKNIFISEAQERTDDEREKRVELHLHTKMSATDGLTDIKEAIRRAVKWGHRAIAVTDHGVVHSFPDAAKAAQENKGKIKVIYGVEGYYRINQDDTPKPRTHHIILLVRNKTGLKNLYELVTKSHIEHFNRRPIIYKSLLEKHRDGLIVGSACERGELFEAITSGKDDSELLEIAKFYDYLEIQPLCNNMFMIFGEKPRAKNEGELRDFNRKVVELGKALNIPTVAACDVHFLDPEHEIFRKIILSSKGYDSANEELPLYYRTTAEMLEEFSYLGADTAYEIVVTNTNKIADLCKAISPLPPEDKLYPPKLENSADELAEIIQRRIPELYGENPPTTVTERADYELTDIVALNYDVIYMAAQKLVAHLKANGSRVGSRGSVGSSFVAYLAGITEVNPLPAHYRCPKCKNTEFPLTYLCGADMPDKDCPACGTEFVKDGFNIPFETFMGFGGEKIPDIDLNVSGEHFSAAQQFIYDMFGKNHVFRAGTITTIKSRNAYKFTLKYLEALDKNVPKAEQNRLISGCLGVKQTTGQHPGGLIVIPQDKDVTDFSPVQHPSDDSDKGIVTLHFEYDCIKNNLIKLDILGHDNPTMLFMLEEMTGINANNIRLDDKATMSIFSSPARLGLPEDDEIIGKTGAIGIPEFGTPFVRQMLCDTKPDNFDSLTRLSGFSHGTNVWLANAKNIIDSGKATISDTISSRDDIMLYLVQKGMDKKDAFAISERVRRGRGLPEDTEPQLRSMEVPSWYLESCNKITYLFPKAHAVAYVMMAFLIAWFKVHKPLEYYSAHFYRRSQNGAFDASIMTRGIDMVKAKIREIKNLADSTKKDEELLATLESCYEFYMRGFDFAPIDLYESDSEKFLPICETPEKCLLRPPFIAISGLGTAAAYALTESRKDNDFISIDDISEACPAVNKTNLEELKKLGALRNLPDSGQMTLF